MNIQKKIEEIFTNIYERQLWGKNIYGDKYCSGPGTMDNKVENYITVLKEFIEENQIKDIFEIGCGDFTIMSKVLKNFKGNYIGSDIVNNVVEYLSSKYSSKHLNFIHLDAISCKELPKADLCIIRQVLQHLSNAQILKIISKLKNFKYVIITEHIPLYPECKNGDKEPNGFIRLQNLLSSGVFLEEPPFSIKCRKLLSYRSDDLDSKRNIIPAIMLTTIIEN
ncbi:MAG: class I SAM-dependent methyltransferase [Sedimentibacter sp.]|uniref:class I SAM-dependent methyltransferase n=1 Tax=Sedimentibacter sp. TaxID=1960295 RepID=UPI002980E573|nr:class I SAM-dependent methyltransferase [Sedimentibacter sp.]MDW5298899.1 class I SAM-dependent methyltransferase [Sedimentibacter sp.]